MSNGHLRAPSLVEILVLIPTYILVGYSECISTILSLIWWERSPALTAALIGLHSLLVIMAMWAHWMSLFTDPGQVPAFDDEAMAEDALRWGFTKCTKCDSIRPKRTYHCKVCRRCILHMDHHCPWIGNCVGLFNQKFFIQYNVYVFLVGMSDLGIGSSIVYKVYENVSMSPQTLSQKYGMGLIICTVIFFMLAVIFTIFTLNVLFDQIRGLYRNQTTIDRLKGISTREQTLLQSAINVFGGPPSLKWLLPIRMKPKYLGASLSAADVVAISILDEREAHMFDGNEELQCIEMAANAQGRRHRLKTLNSGKAETETEVIV